ncbi:hypothetical protein BH11PLA2_BH11PLA2_08250 [soil metagenome]
MIRRVLFGLFYSVIFYFGSCVLTGAIAGAIAGGKDPKNASAAGAKAGREAVEAIGPFLLIGSVLLSVAGTWAGLLPGTRRAKVPSQRYSIENDFDDDDEIPVVQRVSRTRPE